MRNLMILKYKVLCAFLLSIIAMINLFFGAPKIAVLMYWLIVCIYWVFNCSVDFSRHECLKEDIGKNEEEG